MAQSAEGFPGRYRGKIARVVMYEMFGKTVIRSMPSVKPPRAQGAKKEAQEDFVRVQKVVKAAKPFVKLGYQDMAVERIPFHEAMSVNLKRFRAMDEKQGLQWFLPSMGTRAGAIETRWYRQQDKAMVQWGAPQQGMPSDGNDAVLLLAINTTTLAATFASHALRYRQHAEITLPSAGPDEQIAICLAFLNTFPRKKDPANVSQAQWVES
jgi:hypothetical protein